MEIVKCSANACRGIFVKVINLDFRIQAPKFDHKFFRRHYFWSLNNSIIAVIINVLRDRSFTGIPAVGQTIPIVVLGSRHGSTLFLEEFYWFVFTVKITVQWDRFQTVLISFTFMLLLDFDVIYPRQRKLKSGCEYNSVIQS